MFKGSFVALVTPFRDGKVDDKKLQDLVEWQIKEGTAGLVPVGTTGESATLSHEEHAHVIDVVARAAAKRVPVIAGAGSNSTAEAVALTKEAERLGADAVLSVNPYYNKPTQEGLYAHFSAVAEASRLPVVLYNIPSRTGVNLLPSTLARLVNAHKNIVGVKEATGSMDQTSEIFHLLGQDFCVLSGDDSITLPLMSLGARGVISVVANLVPGAVARMCRLFADEKYEEARALHQKLFPLVKALFIETNPAPIKFAMQDAGLIMDGSLRLPVTTVQPETAEKVRAAMKAYGVKVPAGAGR